MAKKHSTRRKPRQPKEQETIEVNGQIVNRELFQQKREFRMGLVDTAWQQVDALALSDVRHAERATTRARDAMPSLNKMTIHVTSAMSVINNFPFYDDDKRLIGMGNQLIAYCATELENIAASLRGLQQGIEKELAAGVPHG
jgi:hypothetical protein